MVSIVADSAADIPLSWIEYEGVSIIPLKIVVKGKVYISKLEVGQDDVCPFILRYSGPESFEKYIKLNHKVVEPTEEEIARIFENGRETIAIFASPLFFETIHRARKVAAGINAAIYCIDSSSISAGEGILVWKAIQLRNEGAGIDEILKELEKAKRKIKTYFAIYHKEILGLYQKRIKISGSFEMFPVVEFSGDELKIVYNGRTFEDSINFLADIVNDRGPENTIVTHFCNPKEAEKLLFNLIYPADIADMDLSVGSFFGPRAIGVGFIE